MIQYFTKNQRLEKKNAENRFMYQNLVLFFPVDGPVCNCSTQPEKSCCHSSGDLKEGMTPDDAKCQFTSEEP